MTKLIYDSANERYVIETSDRIEEYPSMLCAINRLDKINPDWTERDINLTALDYRSRNNASN